MIISQKLKVESRKSGYVLISVLVIMMVLVAMMYFFSDALFSEIAISRNQKAAGQAFHLAEAGVQEAVWKIQNDTDTQREFLKADGFTNFPSTSALIPGGSYDVKIQNTAKAVATITATGSVQMGLKTAQRVVTANIYQAIPTGPYTEDGALFVGGPLDTDPKTPDGNIYLNNVSVTYNSGYDRGSLQAAADIYIGGNSDVEVSKDILAYGSIDTSNSTITLGAPDPPPIPPGFPGGVQQSNYSSDFMLPGINTDALRAKAIAQGQFYTSAQFATLIKTQTTFDGVVYVGGAGGISLQKNYLTINGTLITESSISIKNDTLTINHTSGPSGLIALGSLDVVNANLNIEGLVYASINTKSSVDSNITVTGAILAHYFSAVNIALTLNFRRDWVNETLEGGDQTPVIKMDHWEEEY